MKAVTAGQMQALDKKTIEEYGVPGLVLMENAGIGVFHAISSRFSERLSGGTLVVCGPGNNGGDGLVVARQLFQRGFPVEIVLLSGDERFKGDAATNLAIAKSLEIPIRYLLDEGKVEAEIDLFKAFPIIVDAIFGTGLSRPLEGRFKAAVDAINKSGARIVSVDIPSGLSADTGTPLGIVIKADLTVTMALPKLGHILSPGAFYTGELEVVEIGIPSKEIERADIKGELLDDVTIKGLMKERPPWGHKGTFGHLVVVSGSRGKTGAAALCALGALRTGAGLVTVAAPSSAQKTISTVLPPEAMTLWLSEDPETGQIADRAKEGLEAFLEGKSAVVAGPGIGLSPASRSIQKWLMKMCPHPMVVDADCLTTLSEDLSMLKDARGPRVLTPHPGEMARLLGKTSKEIQERRLESALFLAQTTSSHVVLKGARSIIAAPDGRFSVNPTGNPGMGSGGMGDTLSGIIGGLLAQGYPPFDAARIGVYAHGHAGDILKKTMGPMGYTASDLARLLPTVWKWLTS